MSPSVEPFNEAKYKALMDGREIAEVLYKKLSEIIDYRIESEYFSKKFINNEMLLFDRPCKNFDLIATASNGRAYSSEAFSSEGELYISKIGDVTNKREIDAWEKLSYQEFKSLKGALLKDGDILMTLTGDPPDVGKVNMVSTNGKKCTWNQRVARIGRLTDYYISNYVLYAMLSSELCRIQLERFAKGIRQRNLGNECFSFVKLPMLCIKLQTALDEVTRKHIDLLEKSKELYLEAQKTLNEQIGLKDNGVLDNSIAVKSFKKSFENTGRLDAEYYQLKYDILYETLKKFSCKTLGGNKGIVNIKKSIEPGSKVYQDEGIPFVRVSDINKFEISDPKIHLPINIVEDTTKLYPKKDTILFSKDGSVGIAYKLEEDSKFITSGAILHLTVKNADEVLPDYLTLILNSNVVQLQAERDSNGAIIQHWKPSDIEKVIIPVLDMRIQQEISAKVRTSFSLRRESKELLKYATLAIEIAIEQSEEIAEKWLKEKVANLEV